MSLALVTFISGVSGVFIVMIFLQIMVNLSSKLAIAIEKKKEEPVKEINV
ncbi:Oxaloacetate decarboxylase, gamma chain [Desulfosporosinus orientis DSM 765]|uniref:Oxaloacetate decarboxylase, gamma chain n=1 Tax=Desulfosporosinus orientis (strain ATCC 19365 / DSM 765 / NCIMB 8382 / VKM B-1628 / Singapore I) TaxID=768706 RepID=G7WCV3_DESOD|nr:oxaloacetate decarboxylase subunit gamma [Desulfosporosinus orientis]AET66859.1 Oxaloacetate decarboxylase, gamma chain [Desulfosporosinus orientis DSM 765]